jgi:hypothetical protein
MNPNILVTASALSDQELLARLQMFAGKEREASAELVAHLAALDSRAVLYAAQGYGSLFTYCTQALRLSEDAACNRIEADRACRRFPLILDLLALGSLTLTSVRLLGPHLGGEPRVRPRKGQAQDAARNRSAGYRAGPRPDLPSTVRKTLVAPRRQPQGRTWARQACSPAAPSARGGFLRPTRRGLCA